MKNEKEISSLEQTLKELEALLDEKENPFSIEEEVWFQQENQCNHTRLSQ